MIPTSPSLQGQVALVTGAGSGIGQGAAVRLAQAGTHVAVLDRTRADLDETCRLIADNGGVVLPLWESTHARASGRAKPSARNGANSCLALPLAADVSSVASLGRAFGRIKQQWKRLDLVFANAGINGVWASIEKLRPEEWDRTIAVNLRGTFLTVKFALPLMKQHGGAIILTSSVQGTRVFSNSGASAYATSKAGQVAFGRMCALELAQHRIRVNTLCPGAIRTHLGKNTHVRTKAKDLRPPVNYPEGTIPLTHGAPGTPAQVAELVCFLASAEASHITGTEVYIDGGESLLLG